MLRYNWGSTFNTRDLGYTPTINGRIVRPLRFIRSDNPYRVSDDVKDFLIKNNITTIIDLRDEKTSNTSPNVFVSDERFSCYNYSLSLNAKAPNSEKDVVENYCHMIENDTAITNIFRTMASSAGGILYHCQEGKDRTGIISALLLLLAGVSDIDIYADYAISNVYLYEMIKKAQAILPDHMLYLKIEYIEGLLVYLREIYGTAENYLLSKGVTETEVHKLKGKLLD